MNQDTFGLTGVVIACTSMYMYIDMGTIFLSNCPPLTACDKNSQPVDHRLKCDKQLHNFIYINVIELQISNLLLLYPNAARRSFISNLHWLRTFTRQINHIFCLSVPHSVSVFRIPFRVPFPRFSNTPHLVSLRMSPMLVEK